MHQKQQARAGGMARAQNVDLLGGNDGLENTTFNQDLQVVRYVIRRCRVTPLRAYAIAELSGLGGVHG